MFIVPPNMRQSRLFTGCRAHKSLPAHITPLTMQLTDCSAMNMQKSGLSDFYCRLAILTAHYLCQLPTRVGLWNSGLSPDLLHCQFSSPS